MMMVMEAGDGLGQGWVMQGDQNRSESLLNNHQSVVFSSTLLSMRPRRALLMLILRLALVLYCGGCKTAFALVVEPGGCRHHHQSLQPNQWRRTVKRAYRPSSRQPLPSDWSLLSSTVDTLPEMTPSIKMKQVALQLMEENAMPPVNGDMQDPIDATHPYDKDNTTPIESEFMSLISPFLSYCERDIQSLTTTSTRYLHYQSHSHPKTSKRPRLRSKEEGIRYRTLYSGVQAASFEPEVLRAFAILFEDFLPIRLAGRKIYSRLNNIMEEVREECRGEIARACEICPNWDYKIDGGENAINYARRIWDTLMDEALLLDHSLESVTKDEQSQEGGVISLSQMINLGIVNILIQEGFVENTSDLDCLVRQISLEDDTETQRKNSKKERDFRKAEKDGKYLEMTFPIFMKLLYQSTPNNQSQTVGSLHAIMIQLEQRALEHRTGVGLLGQDTSTLLAARAVLSGSSSSCKKRQKYSNRFDEYVSTFNIWERKFIHIEIESQQSRRLEILRGCFVGARNEKNVAALKIVYMDYSALRMGGDLIFQLMSKIANKIM